MYPGPIYCPAHLVTGGLLLVALLHAGAGQAGEQARLPDAVVVVEHGPPVAAQTWTVSSDLFMLQTSKLTSRPRVYPKQAARLRRAAIWVEVHVTQLEDGS